MRADGIAVEIWTPKLETGLQRKQLVLEIAELLRRHHVDAGDLLKLSEARILGEAGLALVVVGAQASALMRRQIGILVLGLQIPQRLGEKPFEIRLRPLLRTGDLGREIGTRGADRVLPRMAGVEQRLGLAEIGRQRIGLLQKTAQFIDLARELDRRLLPEHRGGIMREVLQLPRRVERLQGFEEPLEAAEPILPIFLLLLRKDGAAPEDQFGDARLGGDDLAKKLGGALLNFGHAVVPVRGIDDEPLRHVQQIAQILERPERQIARAIDVLELRDLGDSDLGELVDAGRVDLFARKTEDDVPAVDQGGQDHAQKFRLNPKLRPVVDAGLPMRSIRTD